MPKTERTVRKSEVLVPVEIIQKKIFFIRGRKVMLDRDLAELYGVETRRLNEQVKRNTKRFPLDFMFQLTKEEAKNWMSQFGVALINSVDDVCHYKLIPFASESMPWPIVRVIGDWKLNGFVSINPG